MSDIKRCVNIMKAQKEGGTVKEKKRIFKTILQMICSVLLIIPTFFSARAEEEIHSGIRVSADRKYALNREDQVLHVSAEAGEQQETFCIETEEYHAVLSASLQPDEEGEITVVTNEDKTIVLNHQTDDEGNNQYTFTLEAGERAEFDLLFAYQDEVIPAEEKEPETTAEPEELPAEIKEETEEDISGEIEPEKEEEEIPEEPVQEEGKNETEEAFGEEETAEEDTAEESAGLSGESDFSDPLVRPFVSVYLTDNPFPGTEGSVTVYYGIQGKETESITLIWLGSDAVSDQTLEASYEDISVEISGILPENGELNAERAEIRIPGQRILTAADLTVKFPDGTAFEPAEGETVKVVIGSNDIKALAENTEDENLPEVNIYYAPTKEEQFKLLKTVPVSADGTAEFETDHLSVFAVSMKQAGRRAAPRRAPSGSHEADLEFADEGIFEINMFDYKAYDDAYAEGTSYTSKNFYQDSDPKNFKQGINVDGSGNWRNLLFTASGIHKGYDEPYTINNYTGGNHPQYDTDGNGHSVFYPAALQGIVRSELKNGYPELAYGFDGNPGDGQSFNTKVDSGSSAASLEYLFNPNDTSHNNSRTDYLGLEHLLYKVDGNDNKLQYDSSRYYAYLKDQNTKDFTVYETDKKPIGFFPFNDYDSTKTSANLKANFNHQFGMTLKADFTVPENGKIKTTNPDGTTEEIDETFVFTGDDDVWVFIDGKLVLDLGGIHKPLKGTINFATGDVTLDHFENFMTTAGGENIYPMYVHVGDKTNQTEPQGSDRKENVKVADLNNILPGYKERPYEKHTIQVFYLERGGCDSNLRLEMNMEFPKKVSLTKEVKGDSLEEHKDDEFKYKLYLQKINYGQASGEPVLVTDPKTHLTDPAMPKNNREIEIWKTDRNGNKTKVTPDPSTGEFTLKHGETVEVTKLPGTLKYCFEEVNVDTCVFPETKAYTKPLGKDEEEITLTASGDEDKRGYKTDVSDPEIRNNVKYVNDTGINISATKKWLDEEGNPIVFTKNQFEAEFGKDYKITFTLIRRIEGGEWETVQPEQKVVLPVYGENDKLIWTDVFSNLPRKDENGNAYEYDVTEDNVPGYEEQTHEFIPSGSTTPIREKEEIGEYWAPVTDNPLRSDRNYAIVHGDHAIVIDPDRTDNNNGAKGTFTKLENITRVEGNYVNDADRQFDHYFVSIPSDGQWRKNGDRGFKPVSQGGVLKFMSGWGDGSFRIDPGWWGSTTDQFWTGGPEGNIVGNGQYLDSNMQATNGSPSGNIWTIYEKQKLYKIHEIIPEGTGGEVIVPNKKIPVIDLPFIKTGTKPEENGKPKKLKGAEFVLEDASGTVIDTKVSGDDGSFIFEKLPIDTTFYLRETRSPDGYMLSTERYEIKTVSKDQYKIRKEGEDDSKWQTINVSGASDPYQIKNLEIYNLPSAGGSGTYWHTVLGTAVFMFAILKYLNERKRGKRHERV